MISISVSGQTAAVASAAARHWGNINLQDLNNHANPSPLKAYGDTKLANILFTRELQRRFGDQGISAVAFHPVGVATNFASDSTSWIRYAYHTPLKLLMGLIPPEKGALRGIWPTSLRNNKPLTLSRVFATSIRHRGSLHPVA